MASSQCNHQWTTVFQDHSGPGGMDDFFETLQRYYDAYIWYQCSLCNAKENEQSLRAYPEKVGYGDYTAPGRLTIAEFAKVLAARIK